jgi:membrane protease YdiL (CAAX protease family)
MTVAGVVEGLSESVFLADLGDRDREPWTIVGTVILGLVVGLIAAFVTMVIILAVGAALLVHGDHWAEQLSELAGSLKAETPPDLQRSTFLLLVAAGGNGAFALGFILVAGGLTGRKLRAYVSAAPRIRWRLLVLGLALSFLAFAPLTAVDRLVSGNAERLPVLAVSSAFLPRAAYALMALLLIPAAAAEEILFRGWLLKQLAAFSRRPWVLIIVTAVAFSAIHFDFNPDSFIARAIMGAGFAYMTLRLGGIELSVAVHSTNNMLIVLFIEPLSLQLSSHAAAPTAAAFVDDAVLIASYVAITELIVRAPALRRWAGVREMDIRPAAPA